MKLADYHTIHISSNHQIFIQILFNLQAAPVRTECRRRTLQNSRAVWHLPTSFKTNVSWIFLQTSSLLNRICPRKQMSWHIISRKETYVLRSPQVDQATRSLKVVVLSRFPSSHIEIPSQKNQFRNMYI